MSGRIIGMNYDDASCTRGDGLLQSVKIDVPAVVIEERVAGERYVVHVGEEIKQRIAGRRDQEFVARIAEQTEDERVCFAGAGCEEQIVKGDVLAVVRIVIGYGLTSDFQSTRIGMILQ